MPFESAVALLAVVTAQSQRHIAHPLSPLKTKPISPNAGATHEQSSRIPYPMHMEGSKGDYMLNHYICHPHQHIHAVRFYNRAMASTRRAFFIARAL